MGTSGRPLPSSMLIDGAEQSGRRFHVAVFDGYRRESSQGFEEPDDVGGDRSACGGSRDSGERLLEIAVG